MPVGSNNSIRSRNLRAAKESEVLLWRALCDSGEDAKEYIEADCSMINPLVHPSGENTPLHSKSEPSLMEAMDKLEPWSTYRMHKDPEPQIVEIDMMAVQIMYRVTVQRVDDAGRTKPYSVDALVTSTWRQGAGGDWKLCGQMCVPE
ncbi:hypothetical protein UCRPA7_8451 [Phaeoacremonium minimum UCRPA7]|uniref:Uncharacterized protein n=1 Tax=Phaeoacremonium minimum (strain UCR-PA7) TaxID=1286976 RepID=R8B9S4_PHAM7|nr:hypothetical protein UCRPA7_8451 [Phaeoacremonium minimum UCRPA7]EON96041.1 hypothetical protein UCRPA7_8451 [Phaeoacremonium minimum UCRPA7]